MPDQIALNEDEEALIVPSPSKPLREHIARYVSNILSPISVSIPFIFLVALYHAQNMLAALAYASATLFFISIGPMAYILVGVYQGKFTDIDVSVRSQRSGPFLFSILSAFVGLLILSFFHGPRDLQTVMLAVIACGTVLMLVTLWWKISMHASALAAAVTMLTALYGNIILPAYVLLILVCWSRVVLRRHTMAQVIAGSLLSIGLSILTLAIRGI
jgi:membrane-associated phospholipid phosphatase